MQDSQVMLINRFLGAVNLQQAPWSQQQSAFFSYLKCHCSIMFKINKQRFDTYIFSIILF
jgi:hypothetical protein